MEYDKLIKTLKLDMEIKNMIYSLAPKPTEYSLESGLEYGERFYNGIIELEEKFDFLGDIFNIRDFIDSFFDKLKRDVMKCNYHVDKLEELYKKSVLSLRKSYVEKINSTFAGYTNISILPVMESLSLNEMLHGIHTYFMNDENTYRRIREIKKKTVVPNGDPITLRGREQELAEILYATLNGVPQLGITDIVSIPELNETIMMIRDLGHATTIDIEEENGEIFVKYFIPKVINVDMINDLPGVTPIKDEEYARGEFRTDRENFEAMIRELLIKIPMDMDAEFLRKRYEDTEVYKKRQEQLKEYHKTI